MPDVTEGGSVWCPLCKAYHDRTVAEWIGIETCENATDDPVYVEQLRRMAEADNEDE